MATGDVPALIARLDRWLEDVRAFLATLRDEDLARPFVRPTDPPQHWTAATFIAHAIEHTGVHLGHLQLQRQIWNAEQGKA